MANINTTEVRLLNVPLEDDYFHTIFWDGKSVQEAYFKSKMLPNMMMVDATYVEKDKKIRFSASYDETLKANYVMYKNPSFSDKWFYAFITGREFVNADRTDLFIETDPFQTWSGEYTVKPSFVEREHVDDDSWGLHTVPEQLELGDYICNGKNRCELLKYTTYVVASTIDLSDANKEEDTTSKYPNVSGKPYGKIYSGVRYYAFNNSTDLNYVLKNVARTGQADAITSIFLVPVAFHGVSGNEIGSVNSDGVVWDKVTDGDTVVQHKNYKPEFVDDYKPNNNKLLSFPYTYLLMSNNAGGSAVYKYELFNRDDPYNDVCDFKLYGAVTPGFSCRIVPMNYNGVGENNEEGLTLGKLPICNWNTDVYTNWLTQNAVNMGVSTLSSAIQIGAGVGLMATGGGAMAGGSMVLNGAMGVANAVGEVYSHSLQPPQAEGNLNSGDVTYSMGDLTFTAYDMSIKSEYAKIIDGYFDMYGYKVNSLKTPNSNHRPEYWYTQTRNVNIVGNIPLDDLKKIKECYDRGITFWKHAANIRDYSVDNTLKK